MSFGRDYVIPANVVNAFDAHAAEIAKAIRRKERIPSKRSMRVLPLIPMYPHVTQFQDALVDRPGAIIVSKGWTLNAESASEVMEAKSQGWYVMAALQASGACSAMGLKPHAWVALDAQRSIVPYLQDVQPGDVLFHDPMVDPAFWEWRGDRVLFSSFSMHAHDLVLRKAGLWTIDLPNHTVSEILQALVQYMGARKVLCVGVDYCVRAEDLNKASTDAVHVMRDEAHCCLTMNGERYYATPHYLLGLVAFLRHATVEYYDIQWFMAQKARLREEYEALTRRGESPPTGQPTRRRAINWSSYRFFMKEVQKKAKSKAWRELTVSLPTEIFGDDFVRDFNP